jgi:hypothetical protein
MITSLQWFPKRFSPGDMDASGGDRLLGKTELSRLAVLIREMAQNSWDARLPGARPEFGVSLRRTDFRYREDLVALMRDGRLQGLRDLVRQSNLRVLEIYDRATHGLDGPADLAPVRRGSPARFQDLILKFGVSHNDGRTGGTYGFGKTAAFAYSGIGTVVYWTRCRNPEGALEDRFIASAFSESYHEGGVQFTGRHWWGALSDDGESVLPVIGDDARELGRRFFERGFEGDETGTSMLVLDPLVIDDEDVEDVEPLDRFRSDPGEVEADFSRRARHAIRANLWPKMVPETGAEDGPMELRLRVAGEDVDLGDAGDGALAYWGAGLNAIRRHRAGEPDEVETPSGLPVRVLELTYYKNTIGHLALVRRVPSLEHPSPEDDLDPSAQDARMLRIALMRGQAELVVTTVDWVGRTPAAGIEWLAVYKSADDYDERYAHAEPPAHDDWVTDGSSGESAKIVRHTKSRVRRMITEEFYPEEPLPAPSTPQIAMATGDLARRLGAMLPAEMPMAAPGREGGVSRKRRAGSPPKWGVEADPPRLLGTADDGRQRQEVEFRLTGGQGMGTVTISVSLIGDDGLHEPVPVEQLDLEWASGVDASGARANLAAGEASTVRFSGAPRRAMRVELSAGGTDGRS